MSTVFANGIDLQNSSAINFADPVNPPDAANKRYVDSRTPAVNPLYGLGFIGDGASHPLSSRFSTLAAAQAVFPKATALSEEIDGHAIQRVVDLTASGKKCIIELPANCIGLVSIPIDSTAVSGGIEILGKNSALQLAGSCQGVWRHGVKETLTATRGAFTWDSVDIFSPTRTATDTTGIDIYMGGNGDTFRNIGRGRAVDIQNSKFNHVDTAVRLGGVNRQIYLGNLSAFGRNGVMHPGGAFEFYNNGDAGTNVPGMFAIDLYSIHCANYTFGFDFEIAQTIEGVIFNACRSYNGFGFARVNTTKSNYRSLLWEFNGCDWQGAGFALYLNGLDNVKVSGGFWLLLPNSNNLPFPSGISTPNDEYRVFDFRNVSNFIVENVDFSASGGSAGRANDFVMVNVDSACSRGTLINNIFKTYSATATCGYRLSGAVANTIYESGTKLANWWGNPPVTLYGGTGVQPMQCSNADVGTKNGVVTPEGIYRFFGTARVTSDATTGNVDLALPVRPDGSTPYFSAAPVSFQPQVRNTNNAPNYFQTISKTTSAVTLRLRNPVTGGTAANVLCDVDWVADGK